MNHPLVRAAFAVLTTFWVFRMLATKSTVTWFVALALVILAGFAGTMLYLLRYRRETAFHLYQLPVVSKLIDGVCHFSGEQAPVDSGVDTRAITREDTPLLRCSSDFSTADIRAVVRGHDEGISLIVERLQRSILLRTRQTTSTSGRPLGAFLLVGTPGIGKRLLASTLGHAVYGDGGQRTIDLAGLGGDEQALLALAGGAASGGGAIVEAARIQPYHTFVLENVDVMGTRTAEWLSRLLLDGVCLDPASGGVVSFQHCLFFLTTAHGAATLRAIEPAARERGTWTRESMAAISAGTCLGPPLLELLDEIAFLHTSDAMCRAEIIGLLMEDECNRFGIRLDFVDPSILAAEAMAVEEEHGFAPTPGRVHKLLEDPLYQAAQQNSKRLILERSEPVEREVLLEVTNHG